jgi:hypothetical protein
VYYVDGIYRKCSHTILPESLSSLASNISESREAVRGGPT